MTYANGRYREVVAFVALMSLVPANVIGEEQKNTKCKEIRTAEVEEKEFIQPGVKYMDLKKSLVQQALLEAVKQTLGTEIRSNVEMQSTQVNENIKDAHNELSMEKAKGFVQSYDVLKETHEEAKQAGGTGTLSILVKANICIPDKQNMQEIVAFGDFLIDKQNDDSMRSVMMSVFPKSEKMVVSPKHSNETFHDIKVQGQVMNVSVDAVKSENAAGIQALSGIMAAVGGDSGLGKSMGAALSGFDEKKKKAHVLVLVQAIHVTDQETFAETAEFSQEFQIETGEKNVIQQLTKKAVEQAARAVFAKLTSRMEKEVASVDSRAASSTANDQKK